MKKSKWFSILSVSLFFFFIQTSFSQNYQVKDIVGKWEKGDSKITFSANGTFVNSWKSGLSGNDKVFKGTFKILKGEVIEMKRADLKGKVSSTYYIKSLSEDKKKLTMSAGIGTPETWIKK